MATTLHTLFATDDSGGEPGTEWLQLLLGDWQVVADLLRADLVLWVPRGGRLDAVAHCRPGNGETVYYEDPIGTAYAREEWPEFHDALQEAREGREDITQTWTVERESRPAFVQFIPVRHEGRVLGMLTAESFTAPPLDFGTPAERELTRLGRSLLEMMTEGAFPIEGAPVPPRRGAPRVIDGTVSLDAEGIVQWASPNALSAFHRFGVDGDMVGRSLAEITTADLQSRVPVDESLPLVLTGRAAWRADMQARGGTLSLRALPLTREGRRVGAIVLVRDVTEVRRREKELMTKDATIREVHHRVKNNLQTVAALLRLQSRRLSSPEAREALMEAQRRVATIALVHESLLQGSEETVFFDEVIERCLRLAVDAASASVRSGASESTAVAGQVVVQTKKHGRVGVVRAEEATPLALVLTELATNAVEHGLATTGGTLEITSERTGSHLVIHIDDDGVGLDGPPEGLGTNIATTLVQGELGGVLSWQARPDGGTRATIDVYLDPITR
ncbi:MAG: histidine kinase N-terminal domain-containing protein [Dermabacter sp.]|nr:histidine kinase N-terminal domain-containing protein [Dermabacter sp.]